MLVGKDILNKIDELVERSYLNFTFDLIGDDFFTEEQKRKIESLGLIIGRKPLIELLYLLVRQRPTEGYKKDATLNQLLDEIALSGILPKLPDTEQYTLDHAKAELNETLENTKRDLKKRIKAEILDSNAKFKNDISVNKITNINDLAKKEDNYIGLLLPTVAAVINRVHSTFKSNFSSNLTDTINFATLDNASVHAGLTNKPVKDIKVYKTVINDSKLCNWCSEFYLNVDGTPKIYKLSDLQANGINDPSNKRTWRAVVGKTHPKCRCQLHYVANQG